MTPDEEIVELNRAWKFGLDLPSIVISILAILLGYYLMELLELVL